MNECTNAQMELDVLFLIFHTHTVILAIYGQPKVEHSERTRRIRNQRAWQQPPHTHTRTRTRSAGRKLLLHFIYNVQSSARIKNIFTSAKNQIYELLPPPHTHNRTRHLTTTDSSCSRNVLQRKCICCLCARKI